MESPHKPDKKPTLPTSIANLSLEESRKLNVDTLKKLKGRDKKIAELTALNEKLAAQQQPEGESDSTARLQVANDEEARQQLKEAQAQQSSLETHLRDARDENRALLEQLGALKDAVRQMAQTKDAAAVQAIAPVQEQLQASHSELLESKTAAYCLTEELSASKSSCAALRDTVEQQSKEISSLKAALQAHAATAEQAEASATKLRQQLESMQGALQALQQQSTQQAHQADSAARQAQDDRDAAAKLSAELSAQARSLQSQLALAEENAKLGGETTQQRILELQGAADAVRPENERLRREMQAAHAALEQAKADMSASEVAAGEKMQTLEKSLQQAQEEAAAESIKVAERDCRAAQAAEAPSQLEQAHMQIQQLQAALKEAQEHSKCSEDSRKTAVQEIASAHAQLRDQGAAAAAANANLEFLRQRCARLEMELAAAAAPQLQGHNMDLPNGDHVEEPAVDVPVEAPGTPVASSARGADGLGDIAVPAKAAMLQARVAELEAQLGALQTEQPPAALNEPSGTSQGKPDTAHCQPGIEELEQRLQQTEAETASVQGVCSALTEELRSARSRSDSLQQECRHSQSQREILVAAVAEHLGCPSIGADQAAAALASHKAYHATQAAELRADMAAVQSKHDELMAQHTALQDELSCLQILTHQHSALQMQHAEVGAQLASLQGQHAELTEQHATLQSRYTAVQAPSQQDADIKHALDILQEQHDVLKQDMAGKEAALAEHESCAMRLGQHSMEVQNFQDALNTAIAEKSEVMEQLVAVQEKLDEARWQCAAATAEASSTKQALADRELLMPVALASGDVGEDEVISENLNKIMSSAEASSSSHEPDRDKLVPAKDLVDAKKRMLATLKKKQADFTKRVKELEDALRAKDSSVQSLEHKVADAEGALKAAMAKVNELEGCVAAAPESVEAAPQVDVPAMEARHASQLAALQEKLAAAQKQQEHAVSRLQKEQEAERERVKRAITELKKKLDRSTRETKKAETALAELRGRAEAEKEGLKAAAAGAEERHAAAQASATKLEQELQSYKARAHALLKAKELELRTAKEDAQAEHAAELAIAQQELATVSRDLTQAKQDAEVSLARAREESDTALHASELQLLKAQDEAQQAHATAQSAASCVEQWKSRCEALEERGEAMRAERRSSAGASPDVLARHAAEIDCLTMQVASLKEEFEAYRTTAEAMTESKDAELAKALESKIALRQQLAELQSRQKEEGASPDAGLALQSTAQEAAPWPSAARNMTSSFSSNLGMMTRRSSYMHGSSNDAAASEAQRLQQRLSETESLPRPHTSLEDGSSSFAAVFGSGSAQPHPFASSLVRRDSQSSLVSSRMDELGLNLDLPGLQESTLLRLAERQAGREEELLGVRQKVAELEAELSDLQREVELRQEQEQALKETLREVERERVREKLQDEKGTDIHYLKNVVLKLYETGEAAALLPVVGMMLQFSPAELKRCQDALAREKATEGMVDASAMTSVDGSASEFGMLSGWTSWAFGGPAEEATKRPSMT